MNTELDILLENLQNVMIENVTDVEDDNSPMSEEAFEVLCAVAEGCGDPQFLSMMINSGISEIRKNPEIALEGATKESIKTLFSAELRDTKAELKEGIALAKKNDKKGEAIAKIKSARSKFVAVHDNLASVKQGPVSMITASYASLVISPIAAFKNIDDLSPKSKAIIIGHGVGTAVSSLLALIPGVGQLASLIGAITDIGVMVSNKYTKEKKDPDKESSEDNEMKNKAGFWNQCQRQMMFILKEYVRACDALITDIKNK